MNAPDRKTTRAILQHWRWWSRDLPQDSAEIYYYTVSPMFKDYAKPTPYTIRYDIKTAEMVEVVMQDLYKWRPKAREWLIMYWLYIPNNQDLADALGLSERWVKHKVAAAHDVFAKHWGLRFMGG